MFCSRQRRSASRLLLALQLHAPFIPGQSPLHASHTAPPLQLQRRWYRASSPASPTPPTPPIAWILLRLRCIDISNLFCHRWGVSIFNACGEAGSRVTQRSMGQQCCTHAAMSRTHENDGLHCTVCRSCHTDELFSSATIHLIALAVASGPASGTPTRSWRNQQWGCSRLRAGEQSFMKMSFTNKPEADLLPPWLERQTKLNY